MRITEIDFSPHTIMISNQPTFCVNKCGLNYFHNSQTTKHKYVAHVEPKHGTCKEWTLEITNQKSARHCCFFAYADCLTTYFRMSGQLDKKKFMSAQCLVEWGKYKWEDIARFCCDPHFGLMTTHDYPYEAVPRPPFTNCLDYQRVGVACCVKGFKAYATAAKINCQLILLFCNGHGFACIGSLFVGALQRRQASDILPYHHPRGYEPGIGEYHSVLKLGMWTSGNESDHYCEIKSSWGTKWDQEGFTKIGFEVLNQIEIPKV